MEKIRKIHLTYSVIINAKIIVKLIKNNIFYNALVNLSGSLRRMHFKYLIRL